MTVLLFAGRKEDREAWTPRLREEAAARGLALRVEPDPEAVDPAEVDYIAYAPSGPISDFRPFTRLKAVLSLWAGVDRIIGNGTLDRPIARMVDPGLVEGMTDYVAAHVLRRHVGLDADITRAAGDWRPSPPPLSRQRRVGVLGLGALGGDAAAMLARLRFDVAGWARTEKRIEGVLCHAGEDGLREVLARSHILVLLLPATPETENILDAGALSRCRRGVQIINPGRGTLIDDGALLEALDSGQVGHATLDVFRREPLPEDHPFWRHPQVTVTPHVASDTRPETAAAVVIDNVARGESGLPLRNIVDRALGY